MSATCQAGWCLSRIPDDHKFCSWHWGRISPRTHYRLNNAKTAAEYLEAEFQAHQDMTRQEVS